MGWIHIKKESRSNDEWIQIQKDGNLDGDLGDSREDIVYRFFPDDQKLSRKSG